MRQLPAGGGAAAGDGGAGGPEEAAGHGGETEGGVWWRCCAGAFRCFALITQEGLTCVMKRLRLISCLLGSLSLDHCCPAAQGFQRKVQMIRTV